MSQGKISVKACLERTLELPNIGLPYKRGKYEKRIVFRGQFARP